MSMRRRIKPAVSLAPRRAPTQQPAATPVSAAPATVAPPAPAAKPTLIVDEPAAIAPPPPPSAPAQPILLDNANSAPTQAVPPNQPPAAGDATAVAETLTGTNEATTDEAAAAGTAEPAKPKLPARRLKPAVCLPVRKRKAPTAAAAAATEADAVAAQSTDTNIKLDGTDNFKSPSQPVLTNIGTADPEIADLDTTKTTPAHRQRIRPTPCLGMRRNSMQGGNESESTTEATEHQLAKRQRHISTSSSGAALAVTAATATDDSSAEQQSATVVVTNAVPTNTIDDSTDTGAAAAVPTVQSRRQRTESETSNVSETAAMFSAQLASALHIPPKQKKTTARSDESQRIAQAKRDFQLRFNGQQPDKAQLTMFDMIFYNPTSNPMKNPAVKPNGGRSRRPSNASTMSETASVARSAISSGSRRSGAAATGGGSQAGGGSQVGAASARRTSTESNESLVSRSSSSNVSSHGAGSSGRTLLSAKKERADEEQPMMMPVPQLKLGPNGEIVLDEKSLVIETTGDKEARAALANAEIVYDDEFSGTSGFYKRNKRTRDWPADETIRFYRCLHTIGTDFSLMLTLFPNRTRRDLKLKFKKEERVNPALINKALLHPNQFNIDELKQDFEREKVETERLRVEGEERRANAAAQQRRKREEKRVYVKSVLPRRVAAKSSAQRLIADTDGLYDLADACPVANKRKRRRPTTPVKTQLSVHTEPLADVTLDVPATISEHQSVNNAAVECVPPVIAEQTPQPLHQPSQPASVLPQVLPTKPPQTQSTYPPTTSPPITINHITAADLGMSCRGDICSDQFVDPDDDVDAQANDDILNMEIVFERDEYITSDGQSPLTTTYSYTYGQSVIYAAPQHKAEPLPEKQWHADDVLVGGIPAIPEIAQIQHNNVILYDVTQSQESSLDIFDVPDEAPTNADDVSPETVSLTPPAIISRSGQSDNDAKPLTVANTLDELHLYDDRSAAAIPYVKSERPPKPGAHDARPPAVNSTEKSTDNDDGTPAVASEANGNDTVDVMADPEHEVDDEENNDDGDDDDDDDEDDYLAGLADSLVLKTRQDADGNPVHEVFLMSRTTGKLSQEPLDLPADVIERIRGVAGDRLNAVH